MGDYNFTDNELRLLSTAFRNAGRRDLVLNPQSRYVAKLIDRYDLKPKGGRLVILADDKLPLRYQIEQDHGIANLLDTEAITAKNRIEKSKLGQDEKSDALPPNKDYVLIKGRVPLVHDSIRVEKKVALRVNIRDISLSELSEVIFVENLAAFDAIFEHPLFEPGRQTIIYRGHGVDIKVVHRLLRQASNYDFNIIAWTDFDPKGIEIALTCPNVSSLVLPKVGDKVPGLVSQPDLFVRQHASINCVEALVARQPSAVIEAMLQNKLAISQEHQISHVLPLVLFHLKNR